MSSGSAAPTSATAGTRGARLATRLLAAQALVLLASVLTAGLVALVVGPPLFHEHLLQVGHTLGEPELEHIEAAYRDASLTSLAVALVISVGCALVVTWLVTARLQGPLVALTAAARSVSQGKYDVQVETDGAGPELGTLAGAFNSMAAQIEHTEDTRRRLLTDLAHEMRTPLATIAAYLEGLDDGVLAWDRATADVLGDQVDRLRRLADDIEAVSKAEEGQLALEFTLVPVADLLTSAAGAVTDAYHAKGVALQLATEEVAGVTVLADRQRLGQILSNLLANALRHTPSGGSVRLSGRRTGAVVTVTVSDTGEGIAAEHLPHVFERFYRADTARDRTAHGSGIGLTISRALAEAHGGSLVAASDGAGHGASFMLSLPSAGRLPSASPRA